MSIMNMLQFHEERKRKEREVLEQRLAQEEAQLKADYQSYLKEEEEKKKAEREAMFGKNPNTDKLWVIDGAPIVFITDNFSKVIEVKVARSFEDLNRQQLIELYNLDRGVYGRLKDGMNKFEVDEKMLSKAYTMRLEEFLDMAHCFELGRKKGYSDSLIEQKLENTPPSELAKMLQSYN